MFWVYENWRIRPYKAVIHRAHCPHCNEGQGVHPGAGDENGRWQGAFDPYQNALAAAHRTNASDVRPCRVCNSHLP